VLVCVLLLPLGMHAPPYFAFQLIFLLFSAVWLVLVAIVAWLASLVNGVLKRRRWEREMSAPVSATDGQTQGRTR
jgi:hypothetical protein